MSTNDILESNTKNHKIVKLNNMQLKTLMMSKEVPLDDVLDQFFKSIIKLPHFIGQINKLKKLDLSGTDLVDLPESIGRLTGLQSLDLSGTQLSKLPKSIEKLTRLQNLNLSSTKLNELPDSINKLTNLQFLSLSNTRLYKLPKGIEKLTCLQTLCVRYTKLTELPKHIGRLTHLQTLDLSYTQLSKLPKSIRKLTHLQTLDLRGTKLSKLPKNMGKLTDLRTLDLRGTKLNELPESIGKMAHLQNLYISFTKLSELPVSIESMIDLQTLDPSYTQLCKLPENIGKLIHLKTLDLSGTKLSELPEAVCNLTELQTLDLRSTQLSSLPAFIGDLTSIKRINISNTHIKELPLNIIMRKFSYTEKPSSADTVPFQHSIIIKNTLLKYDHSILCSDPETAYFHLMNLQNKDEIFLLNDIKISLLGSGGAGKTSLLHQMLYQRLPEIQQSTEGIEQIIHSVEINSQTYNLHFWDFGGQETYHPLHTLFMSEQAIYLIVLNGSANQLPDEWLELIHMYGADSFKILVVSNLDRSPYANINPLPYINDEDTKVFPEVFRVSSTDVDKGIHTPQRVLDTIYKIIENNRSMFEVYWNKDIYKIVQQIRSHYANGNPYLEQSQYMGFCEPSISEEDQKHILKILNIKGIVLTYESVFDHSIHILDPNWVMNAIYIILQLEDSLVESFLPLKVFEIELLRSKKYRYSSASVKDIIQILCSRKLCIRIEQKQSLFIPAILSVSPPKELPLNPEWGVMTFSFSKIPSDLIHELIIKNYHKIYEGNVWRYGVILKIEGSLVVIRVMVNTLTITSECKFPRYKNSPFTFIKDSLITILEEREVKSYKILIKVPVTEICPKADMNLEDIYLYLANDISHLPLKVDDRIIKIDLLKQLSYFFNLEIVNKEEIAMKNEIHQTFTNSGPGTLIMKQGKTINENCKNDISDVQYKELKKLLKKLVKTGEVKDNITDEQYSDLNEIIETKDSKVGWTKFTNFLGTAANAATVATALEMASKNFPEFLKLISSIFK